MNAGGTISGKHEKTGQKLNEHIITESPQIIYEHIEITIRNACPRSSRETKITTQTSDG